MNQTRALTIVAGILLASLILSACGGRNTFRYSEPGPYGFGTRQNYEFIDSSRGDRHVAITVWYPAVLPKDAPPSDYNFDAEPDLSGAPYPLILSSAKVGSYFGSHLASHGFVVIGIQGQDSADHWGAWLIDYPLDILFALNQVAGTPLPGLEGMIDVNRAGAMGYSFDGYTSLALSGARIDPEFYLSKCASAEPGDPAPEDWWIDYICNMEGGWEAFVAHAGTGITTSTDGLWQPMTDERLLAVMPMAPEGAWLFGERGLNAVNRPALIIAASEDDINYYGIEAAYIFENLGAPEKFMITFVGEDHMMTFNDETESKLKHLATAFFGYYLKGDEEYWEYFSQDFVDRQESLSWGVYLED